MAGKEKERQFIVECIQLYRELPSLWNVKSKEYHDRDKKNAAYEILLSKYKKVFPQASRNDVKRKFNSLRTNYRKELKKHLDSIKSGASKDDVYQSSLWYYKEMGFLQDKKSTSDSKRSPKESELNSHQENTTTVEADKALDTSSAVPKTKNKAVKRKLDDELIQLAASRLREKPDEYENWALSCAADLRKMEPMQQIFAKNAIASIIMEGQLGLLHSNLVKINSPTVMIAPTPYAQSAPIPTNGSSTPSQYFNKYSRKPKFEHQTNHLPHKRQKMNHYLNQDNQQDETKFHQENDAENSRDATLS